MPKKYFVKLTDEERSELEKMVSSGETNLRKLMHARVLLRADVNGPNRNDREIHEDLDVGVTTVERVRQTFAEEGLDASLNRKRHSKPVDRKLDEEKEARLIALAQGPAPDGRRRWTLRSLAEKMVSLEYIDSLSHETVRQVLKKNNLRIE